MAATQPFSAQSLTKPVSVTDSSGTSSSTAMPATGNSVRLINEGPSVCFVSIGVGAQVATLPNATATATSTPVLAGEDLVLSIPAVSGLFIAAVCRSAGTATLDVQVGEGA